MNTESLLFANVKKLKRAAKQLVDSVPELQLRNAMRDGTVLSLRYRRAKQILDLGCGRAGVILGAKISPVSNQDCYSDAGGIACAAVAQDEGLAGPITRWRGQRRDGVSCDREDIGERIVQGRTRGLRRGEGHVGGEHREGGSGELEESLGAGAELPTEAK